MGLFEVPVTGRCKCVPFFVPKFQRPTNRGLEATEAMFPNLKPNSAPPMKIKEKPAKSGDKMIEVRVRSGLLELQKLPETSVQNMLGIQARL